MVDIPQAYIDEVTREVHELAAQLGRTAHINESDVYLSGPTSSFDTEIIARDVFGAVKALRDMIKRREENRLRHEIYLRKKRENGNRPGRASVRPIQTNDDLTAALTRIDTLWGAKQGTPEGDELDILIALVERYENKRYPIPPSAPDDWHDGF